MKILLVAGHGGKDPGAVGLGYKEADLTREVVKALYSKLNGYADVEVFDTSKDMYAYLGEHMINFANYDYVVEIHFNASLSKDPDGDGRNKGCEILVHPAEEFVSVEKRILDNLSAIGFENRGIIPRSDLRNMNICRGRYNTSYALIEVCFIDDADDMAIYNGYKDKVHNAIARGIIDGFGLKHDANKTMLKTPNDIAWELNNSFFPIDDMNRFVKALTEAEANNSSLYWGYYKLVNEIK